MRWKVELGYIRSWLDSLDSTTVAYVLDALLVLEEQGPALGRPLVDSLNHSTLSNLKELRPASPGKTEIRILFAFDPKRAAIMLLGGDKSKGKRGSLKWSGWYKRAIPEAERLFREHLIALEASDGHQ